MLPEIVAVPVERSITLPTVGMLFPAVVETVTIPSEVVVEDGTLFGSSKSVFIVPSPVTEANDIVRPKPSTEKEVSSEAILLKEAVGSVPGGKNPPGGRYALLSDGLQSEVVQVTADSNTPKDGIVPTGSD